MADLSHESGKLGNYRALVIGIDDYKDPKIPDLKTAVNDAKAMAKILREKYGFQVKLLLGSNATKAGIYRALRHLAASAKPDESILIYYAGHGDLDRQYNDGWWIPVDAKGGNPITYLDNVQVQKAMRNMKARHVLLISDSCYSGTLFGRARALPPVITDKYYLSLYNEKSRWGMTSGNKTPVSDAGDAGHSIFAYQLLKELEINEKPYLSIQELYTRIAPLIGNNSEQTPLCSPILNTGDRGGEFIFVASSGAQVVKPGTTLSVSANVDGAAVLVDGKNVGETPLSDAAVSLGKHRISIEKKGYEPYLKRVRIDRGRAVRLYVDLSEAGPAKARLYVETTPEDARVRILNIGPVFRQGMDLDPGRYHVEVSDRYLLPTEAEWEYAARAGASSAFCFGDSAGQLGSYAWWAKNAWDVGDKYAHEVGTRRPNAWGLYDMHGNVWEWCQDWYGDYPSAAVTDPKGPSSGANRVNRGGSWYGIARYCRSANRRRNLPGYRSSNLGFRLARAQ